MTTVATSKYHKAPAVFLLALLLLLLSIPTEAQIACDNDGIVVEFNKAQIELKDANVKEITGNNRDELELALPSPGVQSGNVNAGIFTVNSLNVSAFPDNGISFAQLDRTERNVWEANYPKRMYEFANRKDLVLEFSATVTGGESSHIILGPSSSVSMSVADAGIKAKFHGGNPKSLKQLRGTLDFRVFDLLNLSAAGTHRADVSICVNVRGTI